MHLIINSSITVGVNSGFSILKLRRALVGKTVLKIACVASCLAGLNSCQCCWDK